MAKSDKNPTETSSGNNKTGLYVIGAVVVAAIIAGIYFLRDDSVARDATGPKADPELAALMEKGALEDVFLGDPDAPAVIVEYASMTCPSCRAFHETVFPEVKKKYIDTGKARFVLREFPIDQLAAYASMVARCAGNDRFYPMIGGLFETQETWAIPGEDGKQKLRIIAKQAGFSEEAFDKCLADKELFEKIVEVRRKAHEEYGVDATPSFFVNGKRLTGGTIEHFDAALEDENGTSPAG